MKSKAMTEFVRSIMGSPSIMACRRAAGLAMLLVAGSACHTGARAPGDLPATMTPAIPVRRSAVFPPDWRFEAGEHGFTAPHAMVTSNSKLASAAGVEIMRKGGNAVDAAVATGFALAVAYPTAGNIGGGGFMVIRLPDGTTAALDYREVAPLSATRDMYLDSAGQKTNKSLIGHLASGVPGSVAGLVEAQRKYGRLSLAEVMAPAIRLAEEGFVVDSTLYRQVRGDSGRISRFAGRDLFLPGGSPIKPGTRLVQRDLAQTLRRIARQGAGGFYKGETARLIAEEERRGGGLITEEDLASYRPLWREPLRGDYRGYGIIAMPLSSSGGTTMLEALNVLESYDPMPPFESARYKHLLAESFRLAFIDRNTKLCDPAFCSPPVAQLTSKEYARELRSRISPGISGRSPSGEAKPGGLHTTHYSVVGPHGGAVSVTTTLNSGFGSGVYVAGAGFFLNNEMDDLATAPGEPNVYGLIEGEQNRVEPGKRPLSSMSPTIVLDPSGEVLLVVGAAGGPTIITGTAQVILNVIDNRMSLADAMRAPRMHHQAWPDSIEYERNGFSPAVVDSLELMGHRLYTTRSLTTVNAIMRVPGGWEGVNEPRGPGGSAGF